MGETWTPYHELAKIYGRVAGAVERFTRYVEARRSTVLEKLEKARAAKPLQRGRAVVLDPTGSFFAHLSISRPVEDVDGLYLLDMEPPVIPHFFLAMAYLYLRRGARPVIIYRTAPVARMTALLAETETPSAALASIHLSGTLIHHHVAGEATFIPPVPEILELPVESSELHVTSLGLSPVELPDQVRLSVFGDPQAGFSRKLDLADAPTLRGVEEKPPLVSLSQALDQAMAGVV